MFEHRKILKNLLKFLATQAEQICRECSVISKILSVITFHCSSKQIDKELKKKRNIILQVQTLLQ